VVRQSSKGEVRVSWIPAGDGYEVSLVGGKVVARRTGGNPLKSVPKALKDSDAVVSLRQLKEWLDRHERDCLGEVEDWLVRSLPVPAAVLAGVWPDASWRAALFDVVVAPVAGSDPAGRSSAGDGWQLDRAGFLRDVDGRGQLGVVNLDGESVRLTAERVVLPHPVLLADLEDLREFAADLGVRQGVKQLFREIWVKPADAASLATEATRYANGHFAQLRHLTGRAVSLGYGVRGGYVTRRVWEQRRMVDACVWIGADDPSVESETGDLAFVDGAGAQLPLAEVGPVAWSEGMRMAAALYAGRVVEERAA
jgi:hypothetical protein